MGVSLKLLVLDKAVRRRAPTARVPTSNLHTRAECLRRQIDVNKKQGFPLCTGFDRVFRH